MNLRKFPFLNEFKKLINCNKNLKTKRTTKKNGLKSTKTYKIIMAISLKDS